MGLNEAALGALRSGPVTTLARRATRGRLRIVGVHGVPDPDKFSAQMRWLAQHWVPVSASRVEAAIYEGAALPDGAVWVTFDDGDPTVVASGLPVLAELSVPATMFVCPGLIESGEPFWWKVTDGAPRGVATDLTGVALDLTEHLKTVPDEDRRAMVAEIRQGLPGDPASWRQLELSELDRWVDAGMDLGNHTWDHPCLDQCSADAQDDQVDRAHVWLTDYLGTTPTAFAYPNGNFAEPVDRRLRSIGYRLGLLYDNRLSDLDEPLRLSRLMVETDDSVERLRGVLSGAQPILKAAAGTLGRLASGARRGRVGTTSE